MEPSSVDHCATDAYVWLAGATTQPESDSNANRFVGQTQANRRYWWRIQPIAGVWSSDGLKPDRVSRRVFINIKQQQKYIENRAEIERQRKTKIFSVFCHCSIIRTLSLVINIIIIITIITTIVFSI